LRRAAGALGIGDYLVTTGSGRPVGYATHEEAAAAASRQVRGGAQWAGVYESVDRNGLRLHLESVPIEVVHKPALGEDVRVDYTTGLINGEATAFLVFNEDTRRMITTLTDLAEAQDLARGISGHITVSKLVEDRRALSGPKYRSVEVFELLPLTSGGRAQIDADALTIDGAGSAVVLYADGEPREVCAGIEHAQNRSRELFAQGAATSTYMTQWVTESWTVPPHGALGTRGGLTARDPGHALG
jgi:hypothetical protein